MSQQTSVKDSTTYLSKELREATRLIVLNHLHEALRAGMSKEALSHIIAAVRELEKER